MASEGYTSWEAIKAARAMQNLPDVATTAPSPVPTSHWVTRWDPDDGEPYGSTCTCDIGENHNGRGEPMDL